MSKRERNMVIGLMALIVGGGGAFGGYTFVYDPLQAIYAEQSKLEEEIDGTLEKPGLEARVEVMRKAMPAVAAAKRESLPPNIDTAKDQYTHLLQRILEKAKINDFKIPEAKNLETRPPVTPELAAKRPAYLRLSFHIEMSKVTIWQLADFLQDFYKLDLLHQITELDIVRQNKTTETRAGLLVRMNIEAIVLDGAEQRLSLFPLAPSGKLNSTGIAFAAVGGGQLVEAVSMPPPLGSGKPVLSRLVTVRTEPPILALRPRDYSFLALYDIFYGVFHPSKTPPGITIAKIPYVQVKPGHKIPDVKVALDGEGSEDAAITAVVGNGTMLKEGPLTVNQKTRTISFPEPLVLSGQASSYVTVTATPKDGKPAKPVWFKVSYAGDDIASAIKLSLVAESDGAYTAQVFDIATPLKYTITSTPKKGIEVVKYKQKTKKEWELDRSYKQPRGILAISDDTSSTRRNFKVLAIENKALIVQELGDGGVGRDVFRWMNGMSLHELNNKSKVPADEAKKFLAGNEPVGPPEVAGK